MRGGRATTILHRTVNPSGYVTHDPELGFRKKRLTKEVEGDDDGDEDDGPAKMELRLHSPAGAEPIVYQWPLTSGSGSVSSGPS